MRRAGGPDSLRQLEPLAMRAAPALPSEHAARHVVQPLLTLYG